MVITIYELMGLIKDDKAPYKIIYNGDKFYIDELGNYYREKDEVPLFTNIFDIYNDYNALQEKIEILLEKKDEWEDIEEYNLTPDDWSTPTQADMEIQKRLNVVIKNQKYLKERLDKVESRL